MEQKRERRGLLFLQSRAASTASQEMDGFRPGSLIELPQKRAMERNGWVQRGREWEGVVIPISPAGGMIELCSFRPGWIF